MTKANRLCFPPVPTFTIEGTLRSQALKVLEEAAELVEATKAYESADETDDAWDAHVSMMEEAADVNQSLMNLMRAVGECNGSLEAAADSCAMRNALRGRLAADYVSMKVGRDA